MKKGSGAMAERKRAIQLKFYVTEQERALIEEKMKLLQTDNLVIFREQLLAALVGSSRNS